MKDGKNKSFPVKNIALWTGWYFVASYLIFLILFGFDILHISDWAKIPSYALHGFSGFSFGAILIAWVPIWIAGCMVIIKTGRPLLARAEKKEEKKEDTPADEAPKEKQIVFPAGLPEEMRVPYSRLIRGQLSRGATDYKAVENPVKPNALSAECTPNADDVSSMALPENFDLEANEESTAPVFKELNWEDDDSDVQTTLESEVKIETFGDKKFAIATHDDPDFWIADGDNWFATGKQKTSPVAAAVAAAKTENAIPVLLLKSENIMDLADLRKKWDADGVKIITDMSEL